MISKKMKQDEPQPALDLSATTITMRLDIPGWGTKDIEIPINEAFAAFATIQTVGYNNAVSFLNFVTTMSRTLREMEAPNPHLSLIAILGLLEARRSPVDIDRQQREQLALSFTYTLLHQQAISRAEAATIAAALLQERISTDAWRVKIDRWATRNGYPAVGIRKRRGK